MPPLGAKPELFRFTEHPDRPGVAAELNAKLDQFDAMPATKGDVMMLFNLIGALAVKLTGENMEVFRVTNGEVVGAMPEPEAVAWIKDSSYYVAALAGSDSTRT